MPGYLEDYHSPELRVGNKYAPDIKLHIGLIVYFEEC